VTEVDATTLIEIFGGFAMLLSGNPAGAFFIAQGATGFIKSEGAQIAVCSEF
jgi:hypothetical protein